MKKLNNYGFSWIEGLLILVIVGIIGGVGWKVYDPNKKTNEAPNKASSNNFSSATKKPEDNVIKSSTKYLEVKEWGLKMPLGSTISGAYYFVREKNLNDAAEYIEIFDSGFDVTTNKNGVACKNTNFPLFVIGRIKQDNLSQLDEFEQKIYEKLPISNEYLYTGTGPSQAPPACADLASSGDFIPDDDVLTVFTKKKLAFGDAYSKAVKM